jgi:hypothetical protein
MSPYAVREKVPPANEKEAHVSIKRNAITNGILALLAATVVACGALQGASGKAGLEPGPGDNYLTADERHGIGLDGSSAFRGSAGGPTAEGSGPSLQP